MNPDPKKGLGPTAYECGRDGPIQRIVDSVSRPLWVPWGPVRIPGGAPSARHSVGRWVLREFRIGVNFGETRAVGR